MMTVLVVVRALGNPGIPFDKFEPKGHATALLDCLLECAGL